MATIITQECISCGACEPECPNGAISQGATIYVIDPLLCTECVGFHDQEQCAAVCPVDCCVPDEARVEAEEALIQRARQLHPEIEFPAEFPSRFRKAETEVAAPAVEAPPAPVLKDQPAGGPLPTVAATQISEPESQAVPATIAEKEPAVATIEPREWDVPISCSKCERGYTVPLKHFQSGSVFHCPNCGNAYVVMSEIANQLKYEISSFRSQWQRDLDDFREARAAELESFRKKRALDLNKFEKRMTAKFTGIQTRVSDLASSYRAPGMRRKSA
jgi:ferredoxin/predicted RNA-binding Zn-ribbon protein involved in translation (DUF1610 family)